MVVLLSIFDAQMPKQPESQARKLSCKEASTTCVSSVVCLFRRSVWNIFFWCLVCQETQREQGREPIMTAQTLVLSLA